MMRRVVYCKLLKSHTTQLINSTLAFNRDGDGGISSFAGYFFWVVQAKKSEKKRQSHKFN